MSARQVSLPDGWARPPRGPPSAASGRASGGRDVTPRYSAARIGVYRGDAHAVALAPAPRVGQNAQRPAGCYQPGAHRA